MLKALQFPHSASEMTTVDSPVNTFGMNKDPIAITVLSDDARTMMGILAFLNSDHVREEMFITAIEKGSLGFLRNEADLLELVYELEQRQLICRDVSATEPYLATHRTIQWNVLLYLSKDPAQRWNVFQQALRLVRNVLPAEPPLIVPSSDT